MNRPHLALTFEPDDTLEVLRVGVENSPGEMEVRAYNGDGRPILTATMSRAQLLQLSSAGVLVLEGA